MISATSRADAGVTTPSGLPRNMWPKSSATAASRVRLKNLGSGV